MGTITSDKRGLLFAAGVIALLAAGHAALFWPAILTWDAIRQYGQALSGRYDDWHPPTTTGPSALSF